MKRTILILSTVLIGLALGFGRAGAFGQNKVQYKELDWSIITTEHFDVYFYEGEREAAVDAARMAERAYLRLSTILRHEIEAKVPLILYASQSDFQVTNISPYIVSEGTGGFTEFQKRRVTLPFTGGYGDLDHVLTHELVHAFQVDILFGKTERGIANPLGQYTPPLWFMEGMAEYISVTEVDNLTEMWMRDAALQGYLIPLDALSLVGDIRVYRFGQSIFSYIGRTFGDERIGELLKRVARAKSVDRAFEDVLGITLEKFSEDWMEDVRKTYLPQIRDHEKPEAFARRLTNAQKGLSSFFLAPALSPDGSLVTYLTDASLYNDLYLASALDGSVQRRLVKGERREEFESLRFLNASFDFSPDGKRIVLAAKAGAWDNIYLIDAGNGDVKKRIRFELDGIVNPSFSPDGEWIVFAGLDGGRSDLFRCRVDGSGLERLTEDRFLNMSPRYSPDGASIVFVTDQDSTTNFDDLIFASPRLAILDLATRRVSVLPGMRGTNTAPHYFPDGRHVLYVSDRTGIANLYVRDLVTGRDARLTDVLTGVSGIIPLAPAVTLSRDGRRLVFSAFSRGTWDLYAMKDPLERAQWDVPIVDAAADANPLLAARDAGTIADAPRAPAAADTARPAAAIPPADIDSLLAAPDSLPDLWIRRPSPTAPGGEGPAAGARPDGGDGEEPETKVPEVFARYRDLPDTTTFTIDDYSVRFSVDYAAANGYFTSNVGFGAQTALRFSDILGNHNLVIGASIYGSISDSDLLLQYINLSRRTNWGIAAYQFRDDFFLATATSDDAFVSQVYRGFEGIVSRPIDRFRRMELSLEGLQVSESVYRQAFYTGSYYDPYVKTETNDLYFVRPGLAYVHDNALFYYTGPISGSRSSASFDVSFGDIQSSRWIVDYRSYRNIRQRFAFVYRLIGATSHGRDPQVFRIGGPFTLRGYGYGELVGRNVGLVNVEFRFPLIEHLQLGFPLPLGLAGIRGALFFDAGSAWMDNRDFHVFSREGGLHLDSIDASYGLSAAMNIGFAVIRWDLAWPTDFKRHRDPRGIFSIGSDF